MSITTPIQEPADTMFVSISKEETDGSTESVLILQAKTDLKAFGQLYEIHYSTIINYIFHRTFNLHITEELTSNTFFNALRALPKYKPKAPFRAWLLRIATNEVHLYFRKNKRRITLEQTYNRENESGRVCFPSFEWETPANEKKQQERFILLHQALMQLPNRYQQVITLRYLENLAYQDIADVLGRRIGTVKSLIHRGLKKLRKLLEKENATIFSNQHSL